MLVIPSITRIIEEINIFGMFLSTTGVQCQLFHLCVDGRFSKLWSHLVAYAS